MPTRCPELQDDTCLFGKGLQIRRVRTNNSPKIRKRFPQSLSHHIQCSPWLAGWNESVVLSEFPLAQCFKEICDWDCDSFFFFFLHCSWLFCIFPRWNSACLSGVEKESTLQTWEGGKTQLSKGSLKAFFSSVGKHFSKSDPKNWAEWFAVRSLVVAWIFL